MSAQVRKNWHYQDGDEEVPGRPQNSRHFAPKYVEMNDATAMTIRIPIAGIKRGGDVGPIQRAKSPEVQRHSWTK